MFSYSDACTVGMGLILSATSFLIGVFYANQAYDYPILFDPSSTQSTFNDSLKHYQVLHKTPIPVLGVLGFVAVIGFIGHLIRIYKPNPDLRNFEYASLGLYFFAVCVCMTNIKTGVISAVTGEWGEVNQNEGLAVLASSNIILILFFVGVILLQGGLWYTKWDHQVRLKQFFEEEAKEEADKKKKAAQGNQKPQESSTPQSQANDEEILAEEIVEKTKSDPRVQEAQDYYENKIKPTAQKHKADISNKVRSHRTKRKE